MNTIRDWEHPIRKARRCIWCTEPMEPGSTAHSYTNVDDGICTVTMHPACYEEMTRWADTVPFGEPIHFGDGLTFRQECLEESQ